MAVFGMDASCIGAPDIARHCGTVCLDPSTPEEGAFRGIRNGDLIFIKDYTPEAGLDVKALGVVVHDLPVADGHCLRVDWVWTGDRHLGDPDDCSPFRRQVLYEEYNLAVQREVLDLLPGSLRLEMPNTPF